MAFKVPEVSQVELSTFYEEHFSPRAISHFETTFLSPEKSREEFSPHEELEAEYYEDDDLGYYEDGTKRTLTDEQIAIFRHSEMEALRRAGIDPDAPDAAQEAPCTTEAEGREDGEIVDDATVAEAESSETKKRKKKRKNGSYRKSDEKPKPDLRKRTWDKVDQGLDSLDYDDMNSSAGHVAREAQRQRISYDDD